MYESFAFYLFSALVLVSFSFSVFCKNALNAVSALAAGMVFISAIFFLLGAEFLGVVQIIVYTGAVVVLYAFAMMFFDSSKECEPKSNKKAKITIYLLSSFIALLLIFIFLVFETASFILIFFILYLTSLSFIDFTFKVLPSGDTGILILPSFNFSASFGNKGLLKLYFTISQLLSS